MMIIWNSKLCAILSLCALGALPLRALADDPKVLTPYPAFIQDTRKTQFEDYANRQATVRDKTAFDEMKTHILRLYEGIEATNSFYDSGNVVDCVPLKEQHGLHGAAPALLVKGATPPKPRVELKSKLAHPPAPASAELRGLDLTLKPDQKDQFGNVKYCKSGTIPMRRLTLEDMTRFESLGQFLRRGKSSEGASYQGASYKRLAPNDSTHLYARGVQYVDNFGGDAWLNVWSPTVADHQMSLSQLWVVGEGTNPKQTVEAGWQVYPDSWNTNGAALFIFYTTNNYSDGCYNTECDGFIQISNQVYLGKGFDHYSSTSGGQWGFNLQWKRSSAGDWWLFYKGPGDYIAVGYYPKSLFGTGYLATKANKIAFGGEDTGAPSAKQMGSGSLASGGWSQAAFQKSVFYIDTGVVSQWNNLNKFESDPTCYTADIHNIYGTWGTYFYFGGPSCH